MRDAEENVGGRDGESNSAPPDGESGDGKRAAGLPSNGDSDAASNKEPRAVTAMRALTTAVEGDEDVSVELELLLDKLRAMGGGGGGGGCSPEQWRRVR